MDTVNIATPQHKSGAIPAMPGPRFAFHFQEKVEVTTMSKTIRKQSEEAAGWLLAILEYLPSPLTALRNALGIALLLPGLIQAQTPPSTGVPFKALVHRTVTSETFENLKSSLSITEDNGQQDVSKFDES
jgi:hypothetical protein